MSKTTYYLGIIGIVLLWGLRLAGFFTADGLLLILTIILIGLYVWEARQS